MAAPSARTKILPARGTYANLLAGINNIYEGEIVYARDENAYYQKEAGVLVRVAGLEDAPADNMPYVRYNNTWIDLQAALDILEGIAEITDGGDFSQNTSSTNNSQVFDGGDYTLVTSSATDSAVLDGGFYEAAIDTILDGGLATV